MYMCIGECENVMNSFHCAFGCVGDLGDFPCGSTVQRHGSSFTLCETTGEYIIQCACSQGIFEGVREGTLVYASSRALMRRLGGLHVRELRRNRKWRFAGAGSSDYSEETIEHEFEPSVEMPTGLPDERVHTLLAKAVLAHIPCTPYALRAGPGAYVLARILTEIADVPLVLYSTKHTVIPPDCTLRICDDVETRALADGFTTIFTGEGCSIVSPIGDVECDAEFCDIHHASLRAVRTARIGLWAKQVHVIAPFADPTYVKYILSISPVFKTRGLLLSDPAENDPVDPVSPAEALVRDCSPRVCVYESNVRRVERSQWSVQLSKCENS
jgi:hypothetical protein